MAMITIIPREPMYDVIPQAILWRPLNYFTSVIRDGEDGLDVYRGASFSIGNRLNFDLRTYRGHPAVTVTLYLPEGLENQRDIAEAINLVVHETMVPDTAVAWRRGQPFEYGVLSRPKNDRFREPEARIVALKIASLTVNRQASTTYIKEQVPRYVPLDGLDNRVQPSRPREKRWHQVVGNVISHQKGQNGLFNQGLALRTGNGLSVTDRGMRYLNNIGFSEA